jgi:non-ribosomal peptide synthetase component E (peptide arylation enzyme)
LTSRIPVWYDAPVTLLIGEIIRRNAATFPERVAASMEGVQVSYAELDGSGNATACALRELGVGHRDRVVTWADTHSFPLRV